MREEIFTTHEKCWAQSKENLEVSLVISSLGTRLVPLFGVCEHSLELLCFLYREKVAGTGCGHEEMEQGLPFSTINPITLGGLNTELCSQLNV